MLMLPFFRYIYLFLAYSFHITTNYPNHTHLKLFRLFYLLSCRSHLNALTFGSTPSLSVNVLVCMCDKGNGDFDDDLAIAYAHAHSLNPKHITIKLTMKSIVQWNKWK